MKVIQFIIKVSTAFENINESNPYFSFVLKIVWLMIPFSPTDSTISSVKNWYVIGLEAFTIRNKAATMNDVANDKSCAAIDENGGDAFRIICLHF